MVKTFIVGIIAFFLSALTVMACLVQGHFVSGTLADGFYSVTISGGVGTRIIDFSTLGIGTNFDKAENLRQQIQNLFDVRMLKSSLPTDDTAKIEDSKGSDGCFWSDVDGKATPDTDKSDTYYTCNSCIAEVIVIGTGKNATVEVNLHTP